MVLKNKLMVTVFMVSFLVLGSLQWAEAYTFYIDEFRVTRSDPVSGAVINFDDTFNNNSPPPSAPNFITITPPAPPLRPPILLMGQ
jgi:hypothetical protein